MATVTCGLCRKTFEAGPEHCPHCHLRVPGARPVPAKPAAPPRSGSRGGGALRPRAATSRTPKPAGQCPACSHNITTEDTWCKWCHWPVNR
jgi:hypothetical protein